MNFLAAVSWGVFSGGADAQERANLFASWGLMDTLAAAVASSALCKFIGASLKKMLQ